MLRGGKKEEKETEIAKRKEKKEENEVEFPSFFALMTMAYARDFP